MITSTERERLRIPREKVNDYTHQMAVRRRQFIREQTGAELSHVAPTVPLLPPGFVVASPYDTYTFTGGPQFSLRRFRTVTFFIRSSIGRHA